MILQLGNGQSLWRADSNRPVNDSFFRSVLSFVHSIERILQEGMKINEDLKPSLVTRISYVSICRTHQNHKNLLTNFYKAPYHNRAPRFNEDKIWYEEFSNCRNAEIYAITTPNEIKIFIITSVTYFREHYFKLSLISHAIYSYAHYFVSSTYNFYLLYYL